MRFLDGALSSGDSPAAGSSASASRAIPSRSFLLSALPSTPAGRWRNGTTVLRGDGVERRPAVPAEMTALDTAEALKFIEVHRARPFFLDLGHAMPHLPFDASPRFRGGSPGGLYGDVVARLTRAAENLRATVAGPWPH